jgi:short-subunit dehydrogenase
LSLAPGGIAVVTGASSGIGAAIARAVAARGMQCVLVARREDRLRTLAEELGGEYELCDVGDRDEVERTAAAIRTRHPRIALLVNNAGIPGRADFLRAEPERIEEVLRVNYLGGVWFVRALLSALEGGGDIVNIVSVAGTVAFPPAGPYSASKHAQLAFSRAMRAQLAASGIRVHTVNPGFVETEGFPQRTTLRSGILRRLVVEPEQVARRVVEAAEQDRPEIFVPRWYRIAALAQAVAPGLLSRVVQRGGYARRPQ